LSYLAGANYPKWIIQEYLQGEQIAVYQDWQENLLLLRYDHEVLVPNFTR
jgi:carbamoyl-phosphate synthase large subunit